MPGPGVIAQFMAGQEMPVVEQSPESSVHGQRSDAEHPPVGEVGAGHALSKLRFGAGTAVMHEFVLALTCPGQSRIEIPFDENTSLRAVC
jgi:hypothetical protein